MNKKQLNEYFFKEDDTIEDLVVLFLTDLTYKTLNIDLREEWEEFDYPPELIRNNTGEVDQFRRQITKLESALDKANWLSVTIDDLKYGPKLYKDLSDCQSILEDDWVQDMDAFEQVYIPQMTKLISIFKDVLNNKYGKNPMNENKRSIKSLQESFVKNANKNLISENRVSREFVSDWVESNKDSFNPQSVKIYTQNKHKLVERLLENYDIDDFDDVNKAFDELDDEFDDILSSVDDLSDADFDEIANTLASNIESLSKKSKQLKSKRR